MTNIKYFILKIGILLFRFIYLFIKLFKTKNRITFISRQSNTPTIDIKLLEKELNKEMPSYEVIMLTKTLPKGLNATLKNKFKYGIHMFKQAYYIATSKVVIVDSFCLTLSILNHKNSLLTIQMWHAIGSMKKFGYALKDKKNGYSSKLIKILRLHYNYDYIFISSKSFIKDYIEGFNTTTDKVIELPLPKVDLLLDKNYINDTKEKLYKRLPELGNKKNILYCSTFRKNQKDDYNIRALVKKIDFNKYNLLYKPHPLNTIKASDKRIITSFSSSQEALCVADYVICDYSSIMYEVGLMQKPIYIYAYDYEKYMKERELNINIKDIPTYFSTSASNIIKEIEKNKFDNKKYQEFINKNVTIPKEGCTKAIVKFIKEHIKK